MNDFFLFFCDYNSLFLFFLFGNGSDKIAGILTGLSSQDKTKKKVQILRSNDILVFSNLWLVK